MTGEVLQARIVETDLQINPTPLCWTAHQSYTERTGLMFKSFINKGTGNSHTEIILSRNDEH